MAIPNQESVPQNLRKQLAVAVRSIQWSYAIFWALSTTQQGILEWTDGYYNGDIRTRKTVQSGEVNADKLGLQRSQQLRELYESLLEGDSELGTKRPSAALSPEDLTDLEWYYLVCMSFVFKFGQGLPGRTLASGQSIWLCNAQDADSKIYFRSLLAKSACVQTVICFPHMGGVLELGINDLVLEDPNLIQHIKTSLLDMAKPVCSEKSSSGPHNTDYDKDQIGAKVSEINHEMVDTTIDFATFYPSTEQIEFDHEMVNEFHKSISEEFDLCSPDDCSNDCCGNNHQADDSFILQEENNVVASPVQSWHIMDDDLSHCIQDSINPIGCISQAFVSHEKTVEDINNQHYNEIQDCNDTKFSSLDIGADADDDLHYKRALSAILKSSPQSVEDQRLFYGHKSGFLPWKKEGVVDDLSSQSPRGILKKILSIVPWMHDKAPPGTTKTDREKDYPSVPEVDNITMSHLMSVVPSVRKIDKTFILHDTIKYLKELEARVEELESCINLAESEAKIRRKYSDDMEQTSDNYEDKKNEDGKKPLINKRKACDIDETDPDTGKVIPTDSLPQDMKVSIRENDVVIEMRCPWREYLLLDIMDAINSLNLDTHTVQSSTLDGILTLTLKSKFRGAAFASAGMIKQALRRTVYLY
ncbi:hypothetical protein Nepgr_002357 [Nepenthes gracilis]|uniref:Uncharacterized protein n=1 Tax=Nepenthes gracilis TaxID=150966 RepID=A0AAD3P8P8_NEPGR|nr:hypothetical protein Nepgr_002357 [Nepenthes gracilis]